MVMQNKALCFISNLLINVQYASNMHANKQLVNSENWSPNLSVTDYRAFYFL